MPAPTPTDRRTLLAWLAASLLPAAARAAPAWPERELRIVVPVPGGGGTDMLARALAQVLTAHSGQSVAVDNRPGAATVTGTDIVAKSAPDGHTLLLVGSTSYTINPALRRKLPYDTVRDLVPVALVARAPLVVVVRADAPWPTMESLVDHAHRDLAGMRYGTFGPGSGAHLAGELVAINAGVRFRPVHLTGGADVRAALLNRQIEFTFDSVSTALPEIAAGRLRALAVTGPRRTPLLPNVPVLMAGDMPEYSYDRGYILAAPAGTAPDMLARMTVALKSVLNDKTMKQQFERQGLEPGFTGISALRVMLDDEIARNRVLALRANIAVE